MRSQGCDLGGRRPGRPTYEPIEVGAPARTQDSIAQRGSRTPAVHRATDRAECCPPDRVATALVAHLPTVSPDAVALTFSVPSHRNTSRAGADDYTWPVRERCG